MAEIFAEILIKKSNFCLKIEISIKNRKFGQKSKFRSKIQL